MRPPRGSESLLQLYYTGSFSLSQLENAYERGYRRQLRSDYGVNLNDANPDDNFNWTLPAIYNVFLGTEATAQAFYDYHHTTGLVAPYALAAQGQAVTKEEMFRAIMGPIELKLFNKKVTIEDPVTKVKKQIGAFTTYPSIEIYQGANHETNKFEFNLVHEYGHFINARALQTAEILLGASSDFNRSRDGMPHPSETDLTNQVFQQNRDDTVKEEWADMFLYWVYDAFSTDEAGIARKEAMSNWMKIVASLNYGPAIGGQAIVSNLGSVGIMPIASTILTDGRNIRIRYADDPLADIRLGLIDVETISSTSSRAIQQTWVIGVSQSDTTRTLIITEDGRIGWIATDGVYINQQLLSQNLSLVPNLDETQISQFNTEILFR